VEPVAAPFGRLEFRLRVLSHFGGRHINESNPQSQCTECQPAPCLVAANAQQPRREPVPVPALRQPLPRTDQHVLTDIVCFIM